MIPLAFQGDTLWILMGLSVVLTAVIAAGRALQRSVRRRRVLAVRVASSMEDAGPGQVVVLRAKVAAGAKSVRAPISGREAVWTRITVRAEVQQPGILTFQNVLSETAGEALALEAAAMKVPLAGATIVVRGDRIERSYTPENGPFAPHVLEFVRARADLRDLLGANDTARVAVRTFEEAILAGDEVSLLGKVGVANLEPGPDGLYVTHDDVRELARRGTLWAIALALCLAGCADQSKEKTEAANLQRALERYRQADNLLRPSAAEALAATPCTAKDVCEAKEACVASSAPTARALNLKREVERGLADIESGKLSPAAPEAKALPGKLDEASALVDQGQKALQGCDEKMLAVRRHYGL